MKKILSFENPILLNILILAILAMVAFIFIGLPIVLLSLLANPDVFVEAEADVMGSSPSSLAEMAYSFRTYIEYFWIGDLVEFIRRKRHFKFEFNSLDSVPFLQYGIISASIYLILLFVH